MSTLTTAIITQSTRRLLTPHRILRRLRPVKLWLIANELEGYQRTARAYGLIQHFFPEQLAEVEPGEWHDLMRSFLYMVQQAGWFRIDWPTLDDLWEMAMQTGIEEDDAYEPESLYYLSRYLEGIPVQYLGLWSEWDDGAAESYPGLALIAALLGHIEFDYDEVLALIDDSDWTGWSDPHHNLAHFAVTADSYPEPLCWLPEAARYATATTGYFLLDERFDPWEHDPELWRWDNPEDIETLRAEWALAKPLWQKIDQFTTWSHSLDNQATVARILLGIEDNDS